MNRLKTIGEDGGMPVELEDLEWQDAAIREAFFGLISAFGITAAESFKLSGCVVTKVGNDYHCSEGYICLSGEVMKVLEHDITVGFGQIALFTADISYDASGNETFEDTSIHSSYEIRRAKLIGGGLSSPQVAMYYEASTIIQVIQKKLNAIETPWHLVGGNDEPGFAPGWANSGGTDAVVAFKKDAFNNVYLKGVATNPSTGHGLLFALPVGYRPLEAFTFYSAYSAQQLAVFSVQTNGDVWINSLNTENINLSGVIFKIN